MVKKAEVCLVDFVLNFKCGLRNSSVSPENEWKFRVHVDY